MRDFIRRHWLAYLIGVVIAIAVGALAAYIVGIKASTPEDVRQQRIAAEQQQGTLNDGYESPSDTAAAGSSSAA